MISEITNGFGRKKVAIRNEHRGILDELLFLRKGEIDDMRYMAKVEGGAQTRLNIEKLPWYKRLFNKF